MTTKKILLIVGGVVIVLGLVVALIVGGIVWITFSTIGKSEAAQTARTFLQRSEKLKSDIGEVREFGFWVTGNINSHNSDGEATLYLKVVGAKKTAGASVNMTYRNGREWVVVGASYKNDAGQTIELLDKYEPPQTVGAFVDDDEYIKELVEGNFDDKILNAHNLVLVTFAATFSDETARLSPKLTEVAMKYSPQVGFYIVYTDVNIALAERNGVEAVPTLILFRKGKERERIVGSRPAAELSRMIEKQLKK